MTTSTVRETTMTPIETSGIRLRLAVVSGGLSEESATHRLAGGLGDAVVRQASGAGMAVDVVRIDVRDHAQALASASLSGFAAGGLADALDSVAQADALIAVSPTYKASYTGLFKAFWDVTPDGVLAGVPTLIGATGGTPRHSLVNDLAMRPLFAYMNALVLPTAVYAAAEDWGGRELAARMERAAGELVAQFGRARLVSGDSAEGASASAADTGSVNGSATASINGSTTASAKRERAANPFVNVPTMEQMLRG